MRTLIFHNLLMLRQNYWFWPAFLAAVGAVGGVVLPFADVALGGLLLAPAGPDGARTILSTIASAILGVAGVTYSVTIVAVSFASGNFGPRLIGNFMRDRLNQIVLGIFLATFVYALVVLCAVVGTGEGTAFVPQIALLVAIGLSLVCVCALIVFFHHVPESIDIMNLAADIGARWRAAIVALLDAEAGEEEADRRAVAGTGTSAGETQRARTVTAQRPGYVQNIDLPRLRELAETHDLTVALQAAPGDFVAAGEALFAVTTARTAPREDDDEAADATDIDVAVLACVALGRRRTGAQDLVFLVDQLVEMIARALSPSMNDPYTAMICLDWLRGGLSEFARRPPLPAAPDGGRLIRRRVTFEDLAARVFGRTRQYTSADRTVALHVLAVLADLARVAATPQRVDMLREEMRRTARSARERLGETAAKAEVAEALDRALSPPDPQGGPTARAARRP